MKRKIGFIGCGNMGAALAYAVSRKIPGSDIFLCDHNAAKTEALAGATGASVAASSQELAKECDVIFLGVKPQGFPALFEEIRSVLDGSKVLVSMAAGIGVQAVEAMASAPVPVIRIMPNTPVSVGKGLILWCAGDKVTDEMKKEFTDMLSAGGRLDEIPENKIDAASALSGCGPAFVYLFAEALADGAVECGLPRASANLYAAQTLLGAATLLLESGKHPGELKDAVCSPGGTTIEGVRALEEGAFRASAMNAVKAAYDKTLQMKK